jgi:hypothetical protein
VDITVAGSDYVGGLVGKNYGGTITDCYATGEVTGNENTGGLVGSTSHKRLYYQLLRNW